MVGWGYVGVERVGLRGKGKVEGKGVGVGCLRDRGS